MDQVCVAGQSMQEGLIKILDRTESKVARIQSLLGGLTSEETIEKS